MSVLPACLLVLACVTSTFAERLGPLYTLSGTSNFPEESSNIGLEQRLDFTEVTESGSDHFNEEGEYYEWEGYDGWFNNPAHPEWGGAGKSLAAEVLKIVAGVCKGAATKLLFLSF